MHDLVRILFSTKFKFLSLILFASYLTSFSQNADALNENYAKETIATFDNRYEGVKGSPFLYDEWYPGILHMRFKNNNTSEINEVKIKLDVFKQSVYANPDGSNQVLMLDEDIEKIYIFHEGDTLSYHLESINGKTKIVQKLTEDDPKLIKVFQKVFKEADFQGAYSAGRKYDEYKSEDEVYVYHKDKWIKAKTSSKFWSGLFPKLKNEIKQYFKTNNVKDEEELIQLANHLMTLL